MLHFPRWKVILVAAVALIASLLAVPNLLSKETLDRMPSWLPQGQVHLGLDLQGGAHLLYELDEQELIRDWLNDIRGNVRESLRRERIGYTGLGLSIADHSVHVRIPDESQVASALTELRKLSDPVGTIFTGNTGQTLSVEQDGNLIALKLTEEGITRRVSAAIESSIETVRRRVDAFGTTEPVIQRQGRDRILVQMPGIQDVSRLKDLVGQTGKLEFKLVDPTISCQEARQTGRVPAGSEIVNSTDEFASCYVLKSQVLVSGENLVGAEPAFDQRTNEPVVSFRFDTSGARRFGRATQENVGRPFAIVLDNQVISAPVIREPILGGSGQISGSFTVEAANDLAVLLRSGALPAKLTVVEERTVGPSLGEDSIAAGKLAGTIGLIATLIMTITVYGLFGVFAAIALIINGLMLIGIMSALQATLTLPGIAGIVLTIGMAVDANVLIFERIKEELRQGKSALMAIDSGFQRAIITIADSQLTTLAAAIVMFWLGSGPVRGFAVTLSIGLATSVFTAVTVTRLIVALWLRSARRKGSVVEVPV